MDIKYSRRRKGQAQTVPPPAGLIGLDGQPASSRMRRGPVYLLSLVQIADAKPAESVWTLQKEIVQPGQPVEVQKTANTSLNAPSLRGFVSHLPKGANIFCTNRCLPKPDPAAWVSINAAVGLRNFAVFCHSKGIQFEFGIPFLKASCVSASAAGSGH